MGRSSRGTTHFSFWLKKNTSSNKGRNVEFRYTTLTQKLSQFRYRFYSISCLYNGRPPAHATIISHYISENHSLQALALGLHYPKLA